MRRLVPYLLPLVAFVTAAALASPGAAQQPAPAAPPPDSIGLPASAPPAPVPCCRAVGFCDDGDCPEDPNTTVDNFDAWLDELVADAADDIDAYWSSWSSCEIRQGLIYAFQIADPTLDTLPDTPTAKMSAAAEPDVAGCLTAAGQHHGTTFYRHYGPPAPLRDTGAATYSGNYGHKYDHEMYIGRAAADVQETLYLANKTGSRTWAWQYCLIRNGYCPNVGFANVQKAKPYCSLDTAYWSRARFECWYVY